MKLNKFTLLIVVILTLASTQCPDKYSRRIDEAHLNNKSSEAIVVQNYISSGLTRQVKLVADTIEPQDSVRLAYYREDDPVKVEPNFPGNLSNSLSQIVSMKTKDGRVVNVDLMDVSRYYLEQEKEGHTHHYIYTLTITDADLVVAE